MVEEMWSSISLEEINQEIAASVAAMQPADVRFWNLIRIESVKWQLHPWGDDGGGFWVVGLFVQQALWYNDIEDGFNVSRYSIHGTIDEYFCNQDELQHAIAAMRNFIEHGEVAWKLGPPEPIDLPKSD